MSHIAGHDRSQTLLLPESVDDYVGPENPVRFIDAFVDGLELTAAGFVGMVPQATGRPGFAPKDWLKLFGSAAVRHPGLVSVLRRPMSRFATRHGPGRGCL